MKNAIKKIVFGISSMIFLFSVGSTLAKNDDDTWFDFTFQLGSFEKYTEARLKTDDSPIYVKVTGQTPGRYVQLTQVFSDRSYPEYHPPTFTSRGADRYCVHGTTYEDSGYPTMVRVRMDRQGLLAMYVHGVWSPDSNYCPVIN